MSAWPQITAALWLALCVTAAAAVMLQPEPRRVVLTPQQQRMAALWFAVGAISEASVLWLGGFWS